MLYNKWLAMLMELGGHMPIYTYKCDSCGLTFEKTQKFSDKPLTRCPECRGAVRRLIQPAGIVFKGSGWYITDSKKSSSASVTSGKNKDSVENKPAEVSDKPADKKAVSSDD